MTIEVEIKLAIGPAAPLTSKLLELGARITTPRGLETNVLLEMASGQLYKRGRILRIRRYDGAGTLTYKEPAEGPPGFKVRREIEAPLSEPEAVHATLAAAGLRTGWRYEKMRTVLRAGELALMVDETPIGNFLEIEGPAAAITDMTLRLGRSPSEAILGSYRDLYVAWCQSRGLPVGDMLFPEGFVQ